MYQTKFYVFESSEISFLNCFFSNITDSKLCILDINFNQFLASFFLFENLKSLITFSKTIFIELRLDKYFIKITQNIYTLGKFGGELIPILSMENVLIKYLDKRNDTLQNLLYIEGAYPLNIYITKSSWKNINIGLFEGGINIFSMNNSIVRVNDTKLSNISSNRLFISPTFNSIQFSKCIFIGSSKINLDGSVISIFSNIKFNKFGYFSNIGTKSGKILIENSVFQNFSTYGIAGVIYFGVCNGSLLNNIFSNNYAYYGGVIYHYHVSNQSKF